MSPQWNRELSSYVSKVIECLKQNIRKSIDCKRPSNTKQMNRLQNIPIELLCISFSGAIPSSGSNCFY